MFFCGNNSILCKRAVWLCQYSGIYFCFKLWNCEREYSKKGLKASKILMWIVGILAGLLCGMFAGIMCSNKIEEKRVKKIMSVLLIVSGISLILKTY